MGLKRDCPELLHEIIQLDPDSEGSEWIKVFATSDLLLAAYTTPYNVIVEGVTAAALGLAKIHSRIISGRSEWELDQLPPIHILGMLQHFFSQRYGYQFLMEAIPEAVQQVALTAADRELKAYAIFFLSMAYKELGGKDNFDFLLTEELKPLPLPIDVFMTSSAKDLPGKSKPLRKHLKHVVGSVRADSKLKARIDDLFERSTRSIMDADSKKAVLKTEKKGGREKPQMS